MITVKASLFVLIELNILIRNYYLTLFFTDEKTLRVSFSLKRVNWVWIIDSFLVQQTLTFLTRSEAQCFRYLQQKIL